MMWVLGAAVLALFLLVINLLYRVALLERVALTMVQGWDEMDRLLKKEPDEGQG